MTTRAPLVWGLGAVLACSGSPPRPQWKVYVATDEPVPALGQQLLVELIDASGDSIASDETRLLDASSPDLWPISFGIVPSSTGAAPPRIRARLYRLDQTGADGIPVGQAFVDMTAVLPVAGGGITGVSMTLAGACFGVAPQVALAQSCDPTTGALAPEPTLPSGVDLSALPVVGSWAAAQPVACPSTPPAGMQCIPGGVALLGSTQFFPEGPPLDPSPQQLVQLGPFAIDANEVTVGTVRQLVALSGLSAPQTGDPDTNATPPACTYHGVADSSYDLFPVNCVSWAQASQACALMNKRLPTEAEWEYVASNLGEKTPFPWGANDDICSQVVVGRGRASVPSEDQECETDGGASTGGPIVGGSPADVTELKVHNLAGNVNEWVADWIEPYTGPCWQPGSTLMVLPPPCATPPSRPEHAVRGTSWNADPQSAHSYVRNASLNDDDGGVATGFRCALSM